MTTATPPVLEQPPVRAPAARLRVLFALAGAHRVCRGAEVAFESIAEELAKRPDFEVTMLGSGTVKEDRSYTFWSVPCTPRERFTSWPRIPVLRDHYAYEEATFARALWGAYNPRAYDVTVACSYPFCNWLLRTKRHGRVRPPHVFVTQNGDWPCQGKNYEYRFFGCDGLVCTNPEFYQTNHKRWPSVLIPNGVDPSRFAAGPGDRAALGLPAGVPVVLMVSALIPSKRVLEGIQAVARLKGVHLLVLGDGELKSKAQELGSGLMGDRFHLRSLPFEAMPGAYRCADVFLHMSKIEPFGNVYVEALASGLPVVTHDREATRWTLEGLGTLVNTDEPDAVAAGVLRALDLRTPAHAAARRALVERRFSWAAIADGYAGFLRQVVSRAAERRTGWWAPSPVGVASAATEGA